MSSQTLGVSKQSRVQGTNHDNCVVILAQSYLIGTPVGDRRPPPLSLGNTWMNTLVRLLCVASSQTSRQPST
eukprot:1716721-Amphidinium_carterae.1